MMDHRTIQRIYLDHKVSCTNSKKRKRMWIPLAASILVVSAICLLAWIPPTTLRKLRRSMVQSSPPIPRKQRNIHFIFGLWDDGRGMPRDFRMNFNLYEQNNEHWRIMKWFHKASIQQYVEKWIHPNATTTTSTSSDNVFENTWEAWQVARPVQQADLFRYIVLWKMGGFYFDLDVQITVQNSVDKLMEAVGLDPSFHTAAVFFEKGRLSEEEVEYSKWNPGRDGLPEYSTRLSNYALWSRPYSSLMECAIQLATFRILKLNQQDLDWEARLSTTLYTTGPDIISECTMGVRERGFLGKGTKLQDEEEVVRSEITTDNHILVKDPGPNIVNGNSFSWKVPDAA